LTQFFERGLEGGQHAIDMLSTENDAANRSIRRGSGHRTTERWFG
jgi:hypothetical protein